MNILVTGANGQLGNEIQIAAAKSKDTYLFTDVIGDYQKLDITKLDDIRQCVKAHQIECIINCAAWTNVDAAETAGEIVEKLKATAPGNIAIALKKDESLLLHIRSEERRVGEKW